MTVTRLTGSAARVVIVGGGIAAVTAAHALREEGFDGHITSVGDEPHAPYSRPALSKGVVAGRDDDPSLPPPSHGGENVHGRAVGIDPEQRRVQLADGTSLPYDGLVIATGSRARILGDPELSLRLRGLDDARHLRARLAGGPDVVIVGGGALAMELASQCRELGCAVTVITRSAPMRAHVGWMVAELLCNAAREDGVTFVRARSIEIVAGGVRVDGDAVVRGELVLSAVGDVPADEWLADSGLLTDGAVLIDHAGLVAPGIVAAGDVAVQWRGDVRTRTPLWFSAIEQAGIAARTLVRGSAENVAAAEPYFWTEQFGHSVKAIGSLPVDGADELLAETDDGWLRRWGTTAIAFDHRIPLPRLRRAAAGG